MTAVTVESGKLDIGRVIQQTFAVIGRNAATFFVLGFLFSGVPQSIAAMFQATNGQVTSDTFNATTLLWIVVSVLVTVVTSAILQGTLIYATVQDLNGGKASTGESLSRGLAGFLPLIGASIVFTVAAFFGMLLLIVPGVMVAVAWCVCIPALVAERKGVFGSFSRAADLTRGNRWRIFGLGVIAWIILMVILAVLAAVGGASMIAQGANAGPAAAEAAAKALSPVAIALNLVINTVTGVLTSAGLAVLYVELRRLKDGGGSEWLSEVFA
jgi:hypothetical protein